MFHSFKAHLNPIAIDGESGKVRSGWLRLYQNNLYVHLRGQMKETAAPKRAPSSTTKPSLTSPPLAHPRAASSTEKLLEAELTKLRQEITELRDKFTNYITSHEACCMRRSNSPSESSGTEDRSTRATPRPPPALLTLLPDGSSKPAVNPPTWLVAALAQQDLPITFRDSVFVLSPLTLATSFPEGTLEVIKLKFDGASPLFLGTHRDGDLRVSTAAPASTVTMSYNLPHDPYVPTLPRRRK
ncbi:hypothetical protein EDC04DRAFT_2901730 [Pisolithus marmoratus]|nr:hypothetical protein EDC04DRAFT_2901730 [Pisolithus marmoratus]